MNVRHGDELHRADGIGAERLTAGAGAATAATDHGDLDFVTAARGMRGTFRRERAEQGATGHGGSGLEETPPAERFGENNLGWFIHEEVRRWECEPRYAGHAWLQLLNHGGEKSFGLNYNGNGDLQMEDAGGIAARKSGLDKAVNLLAVSLMA
ncbi:hypothetical protein CfE428DRAFT_1392 [Chthoniobacter flavus Ellin428]|uniref:Uncharacterized protein n=1 Tax=Chthoniobacter flavus Ellin428 TaxID=497964 RepID=B4CXV1_9BACT|nr:hypothetical protein [Chthoniobacter flavus]EDY21099.1 hypothetical protein CfE428DRAFT_1392 [Chthoniobacter flavus Ellin428]